MRFRIVLALVVALGSVNTVRPVAAAHDDDIRAGGAFTCDFGLPGDLPFEQVPVLLERDRMVMAARPGFIRKLVPLRIDLANGEVSSGGRYLFETRKQAEEYRDWVTNEFVLDGVLFFDRPYFLAPDCHAWSVIGAHDFWDIHAAQVLVRTERWRAPGPHQRQILKHRWPAIRAAAEGQGVSSVWLLHNSEEDLVSLVYVTNRFTPPNPVAPDFVSLTALEYAPPLGQVFDDLPWTRTFDRTQWVLTTWFPYRGGDRGEPALWPNSPPFPQPFAGDGLCEPSRGENPATAPGDCQ